MAGKKDIKVYRLKIIYTAEDGVEILHLSEGIDGEGPMSLNIEGRPILVSDEMAQILDSLDNDEIGLS
jgi:hypothetical protein